MTTTETPIRSRRPGALDGAGRLVAHATSTRMIFRPGPGRVS